jgi:predicted dehydrogenase
MNKLRTAVIGVGYLGRFHAEKYARMADIELAAVVDTDRQRAAQIARCVGTTALDDYRPLLGRVDAVSIAVPTPAHFAVCRDFLNAGVDVLVEKPITTTLTEADELNGLAAAKGRILQVGHLERFNPAVKALREVVHDPVFVESHRLAVFKPRCLDVSVVLDLMIHDIDIVLHFVAAPVKSVAAIGAAVVSGQVDIANARLEFENGAAANMTASRISLRNERKIRFFQKSGSVAVDFAERQITLIEKCGNACGLDARFPGARIACSQDQLIPGMTLNTIGFGASDPLDDEIRAFVQAVRERTPPLVSGHTGRQALAIALTVMEKINHAIDRLNL